MKALAVLALVVLGGCAAPEILVYRLPPGVTETALRGQFSRCQLQAAVAYSHAGGVPGMIGQTVYRNDCMKRAGFIRE